MKAHAVFLIVSSLSSVAVDAQLVNGNLDDPAAPSDSATGWTLFEEFGADTASFQTFSNHTPGGERGLWFRPFEATNSPPSVDAILFQDVAANPGVEYGVGAWFKLETGYSGLDPGAPTNTVLGLEFRNGGGLLGVAELDIDTSYDDSPGSVGTWQQFQVTGTSPPGTTIVRVRASMIDGVTSATNPQSAHVDDLELFETLIFADGFESGGTTQWSMSTP